MIPDRLDTRLAIPKGVMVRVRTTNGGEVIARTVQTYRPTYSIVVNIRGDAVVIPSMRLREVVIAE